MDLGYAGAYPFVSSKRIGRDRGRNIRAILGIAFFLPWNGVGGYQGVGIQLLLGEFEVMEVDE